MSRAFFLATPLLLAVSLMVAALLTASISPAAANEFCNQDLGPLVKDRVALEKRLEQITRNASQPGARERYCAAMASLIGNMRKTEKYMTENQSFCQIPVEVIAGVKKGIGELSSARRKICSAPQAPAGGEGGGQALPKPPVELRLK